MKFLPIHKLLQLIEPKNRKGCEMLYSDFEDRFNKAPGSLSKHQVWKGGYVHHLEETMSIAHNLFQTMNKSRKLTFTVSDVLLVLFLHDLEKPFKYISPKEQFGSDHDEKDFVLAYAKKYKIKLTKDHINALMYIHGEGDDYHSTKRIQKPLAAFAHICDVISARIWFNYPIKANK
jgi:hypothetical protein